ncbi:hypothetical protein VTL71DRAFT_14787 [Oculimacula yallundae]|uniref:Uncharacterized protein n=1 Tax=Oculimacula yallundae TaxID=86028 RepID=A0ABR4CK50_9HELO
MHFKSVASLVALMSLATTTLADSMYVEVYCYLDCRYPATFYTSAGSYSVTASDGCRGTSVPGMVEFCVDNPQGRGHFRFSHQNFKRCMRLTRSTDRDCGIAYCQNNTWEEVPCTWRIGDEEGAEDVESVSVVAETTAVATSTFVA